MAVYFNKSRRFGQFKCVLSEVEFSQRRSVPDSTGAGGSVVERPHRRLIPIKVALLLTLGALCKPTASPFIESFPFLPLLITLLAFASAADRKTLHSGASFEVEIRVFIV